MSLYTGLVKHHFHSTIFNKTITWLSKSITILKQINKECHSHNLLCSVTHWTLGKVEPVRRRPVNAAVPRRESRLAVVGCLTIKFANISMVDIVMWHGNLSNIASNQSVNIPSTTSRNRPLFCGRPRGLDNAK